VSQDPEAKAAAGLVVPWLTVAAGSIIMPWALYLIPSGTLPDPLAPSAVWKALWPVLLGAALAIALWRWPPRFERAPQEEIGETESRATKGTVACGKAVERMDAVLRSWPAAGLSLVILIIALGGAILVR
jgi:multicomponent Na+:H+ antiporter subunit A